MVVTAIISIVVGFVVGVLSGMLGIGGGTILVPVFTVFFGLAPVTATGTSLFTIFFTSISGAISRVRGKTCSVPVGVAIGIGGAITSPLGVYAAVQSPEIAVVLAVVAVIVYSMVTTLRKALKKPEGQTSPQVDSLALDAPLDWEHQTQKSQAQEHLAQQSQLQPQQSQPQGQQTKSESERQKPSRNQFESPFSLSMSIRSVLIGLIAGVLSGYVGLGGGFIMIPLMRSLLGYSMKQASGTSLMGILFIALSGSITQISFGNVDFLIGIAIVVGSIPGAVVGSLLVKRIKDNTLSFLFVGFLAVATMLLIIKQLGFLG